jgi:hypothetical protein
MFLDRPAPDAELGIWSVAVDRPLSAPTLFTHRLDLFSQSLSLVVDLEDGQTVVKRLRDGARWVIPNGGRPVSFSPDGRRVAWSAVHRLANFDLRRTEIWLADADGRRARMIAARFGGGIVGWMPDAMGLLVGGRRSPHAATAELTLFDLAHESERALLFYERLRGPAVSPSGRWLVYFVTQASDPAQNGTFALDLSQSLGAPQRLDLFPLARR